eukprot:GHVU01091161.1.p1 GENE.GHVU01091161.1~~GHVU01091161.1.p1  ORF type:complete len:941 (-),score=32.19 GHVU01091161.1:248-3070(-)
MSETQYQEFANQLKQVLPEQRIISTYAKRLAYSTDASFYRLIPQLVLQVDNEAELIQVMLAASVAQLAVTFRAAGTSLSGQAQSDSILIMLTNSWRDYQVLDLGLKIKLAPGVIGSDANKYLAPYGRKIGPDPASINTCKIAGIAANNASGMCCGVAQNSYHTLDSIRIILHDGTVLDTANASSIASFRTSHKSMLDNLTELALSTQNNAELRELIRYKYRLKNTTGYAINALIDFEDPIDILAHLMIGSEGTLGFISSITYNTVVEHKHRASSLVFFADIDITCHAVKALTHANLAAVELLDQRSLASVADMPGSPEFIGGLGNNVAALLIETRAANKQLLATQIAAVTDILAQFEQVNCIQFTSNAEACANLWAIRKGTFPAVGAVRETGTTVIIEDVAFPVENLAAGVSDLQQLFDKYHYDEAIIFGHALEGNLHFVFTQDFSSESEIKRYQAFMHEVCELVAVKYQGSLKAEHGTGRNMAPFIEMEWGKQGYQLMLHIKALFDPKNLINPGVIINHDADAHIRHLKALPAADELVDKCIECGFCEPVCPSNTLSFTPRQRITSYREIQQLRRSKSNPELLKQLEHDFNYLGIDTCAATGLCADLCPVGINTGDLIRKLRGHNNRSRQTLASTLADSFAVIEQASRGALMLAGWSQKLLGNNVMGSVTGGIRKLSANKIPLWNPHMPAKADHRYELQYGITGQSTPKVVYMPSCSSRIMGPAMQAKEQRSLPEVTSQLLKKAGFEVIHGDFTGQCCGMPFNSKGMFKQAEYKRDALAQQLVELSNNGEYPILFDTSPCKSMLLDGVAANSRLKIYEPVGFIEQVLTQYLQFNQLDETVMLHVTCSSRRMGLSQQMVKLANRCANKVVVPEHIACCGFAGDKGFTTPELNASALLSLKSQVPAGCSNGYSNSRTCEIGLSHHSGIDYQSIIYLVDKAT